MGVPEKLVGRVGGQAQGVSSPSACRGDAACRGPPGRKYLSGATSNCTP